MEIRPERRLSGDQGDNTDNTIANPYTKPRGAKIEIRLYYYQNCYAATEKVKVEAPRAVEENFAAIASYQASSLAIESSRSLLSNAPLLAFWVALEKYIGRLEVNSNILKC